MAETVAETTVPSDLADPTVPSGPTELTAPIVGVTVFPDQARITRTGRVRLAAGEHQVLLDRLPLSLMAESVRVAGRGPATVLGVDVTMRHYAQTTDEAVRDLEDRLRAARAEVAALDDEAEVLGERLAFLSGLATRATGAFARALAAGDSDPARATDLISSLATQQTAAREERRALAERRRLAVERMEAAERALANRKRYREPDRQAVWVGLLVEPAGPEAEIELEVTYLVAKASWYSAYDLRLAGTKLALTWYGLVSQHSGEDWPECDLRLSTARPSSTATVPELDPWFLDRYRPAPPPMPRGMARGLGFGGAPPPAPGAMQPMAAAAPMAAYDAAEEMDREVMVEVAAIEQGATAATYQPARPVAVPSDGGSYRATVAVAELDAVLDYVTAPVLNPDAHLRAKVTNSSPHTLLPGNASVFHGADFIGSTGLAKWAPGEEIELALGIDDRVRVERELVRRTAGKAVLGGTRRREAEHKITVANHTPAAAKVTVLDQLPVSRDEGVVVKDTRLDPAPTERTEMGVLTWVLHLEPGQRKEIHLAVRVELGKGVEMVGWRE